MNFTESDIHRLIDGELSPEAAAGVEAWIAADAGRRRSASAYRLQRDLLHVRFDPLLNESIPPQLLAAARIRKAANDNRFVRWAAQAVFAAVCVGAGWFAHTWTTRSVPAAGDTFAFLPRRAAVAHSVYVPEVRHPVEVGAEQEGHLVQWLSKRLSVPVRAPGLSRLGFRLVGGRLLPGDDKPVAQFMYQNEAGKRLTLYVVALTAAKTGAPAESAFRFETVGNVSVFYWREDGRGYALSGDLARAELMPVARLVYDELNAPESKGG
jgi:anti-sigma factor RsiW